MSGISRLIELVQGTYPIHDRVPPPTWDELARSPSASGGRQPLPPWLVDPGNAEIIELGPTDMVSVSAPSDFSDQGKSGDSPDVLAYYLPFHFYRARWGIYIRAAGILQLTRRLLRRRALVGTPKEAEVARVVLEYLLAHETFHHFTELAISRFEAVGFEPTHLLPSLYERYFHHPTAMLLEEALANAFAMQRVDKALAPARFPSRGALLHRLDHEMRRQPAGYRDFARYVLPSDYAGGQDSLLDFAKSGLQVCRPLGGDDGLLPGHAHFVETELPEECVVRLVLDRGSGLSVLRPFPKSNGMQVFVYVANEHPPPHFHLFMPPEREYGRYEWPSLAPLRGSNRLTRKQEKALRQYIAAQQPEIYAQVRKAFPGVPDVAR